MDLDLREYLDAKFAAVDGKLADLRTYMDAKFAAVDGKLADLRTDVDAKFAAARIETHADVERTETNLLRAFHGWSRPMEMRIRRCTEICSDVDERLGLIEDRLSSIERRLPLA
jgi:hypothetical protein